MRGRTGLVEKYWMKLVSKVVKRTFGKNWQRVQENRTVWP